MAETCGVVAPSRLIGMVSDVASRLRDEAKHRQILISPPVLMAVKDAVTVEPVSRSTVSGVLWQHILQTKASRTKLAAVVGTFSLHSMDPRAQSGVLWDPGCRGIS
jgi:class 3 adenylate cyclase